MSLSTPTRSRSRRARCVAALALLCAVLAPAAAWAQPPGVVAEGTEDGRARLIVDNAGGTGPVAVTVDGRPQPITPTPLLSDRSAMALVVDASTAGGQGLQPGLAGLVDFALATPPGIRTALVADTTPPAVVTPLQLGPAGVLPGLSALTPRGDRQTAAALDLATAQLPREPDSPRLVVLYTTADNTRDAPEDLAARLRAAGVVLAVVNAGDDDSYWAAVATGTGGVAVRAPAAPVVGAFAQLGTALRARSLVTLPASARTPTAAVVQVGGRTVAAEIPAAPGGPVDPTIVLAAVVAGVVALALAVVAASRFLRWVRRVRPRRRGDPVWNIPGAAAPSVKRRPMQVAIEDALSSGGPVVVRPSNNGAGMGVTTAMAQFADRYRDVYDVAWWITAQDPQLIGDQMARLAEALGVAAPTDTADQAAAAALAALRGRRRWLVVFDDAGSQRDLAQFLPDGPGHVLVGATAPDWGVGDVEVPPFSRAESVALLRAWREGLTAAEADHVAEALGDIPLDVDMAGATLAATGMSVSSYVKAVAEAAASATAGPRAPAAADATARSNGAASAAGSNGKVHPPTGPENGKPGPKAEADATAEANEKAHPAAEPDGTARPNGKARQGATTGSAAAAGTAWTVAIDRLAADDPPALALLTLLAWLAPEPVPQALLTEHAADLPPALARRDLSELTATLARRGLGRVVGPTVQLHRLPSGHLVRRTADERPDGACWATWVVRLLRAAVPTDPNDPASWPAWRQLMPHVLAATDPRRPLDDVAVEVGWLLHQAAVFLQARGEQESARALLEDAHDLYLRKLGPEHAETRTAARALADNLRALGRPDQASLLLKCARADGE